MKTFADLTADLETAIQRIEHWKDSLATITDVNDTELVFAAERLCWWMDAERTLRIQITDYKRFDMEKT